MRYVKEHLYSIGILLFVVLLATASFYRFFVLNDYLVNYEDDCDPYTESCFLYCEDEECSDPFYYSVIERHADEIYNLCGTDVTACDAAYECQPEVEHCTISFCDPVTDGDLCETLTEEDMETKNFTEL